MDWLKLAVSVVQLLGFFMKYLTDRQLLTAGGAQMVADILRGQADDIAKANKARADVIAAAQHDPASILRDDDGFRRD